MGLKFKRKIQVSNSMANQRETSNITSSNASNDQNHQILKCTNRSRLDNVLNLFKSGLNLSGKKTKIHKLRKSQSAGNNLLQRSSSNRISFSRNKVLRNSSRKLKHSRSKMKSSFNSKALVEEPFKLDPDRVRTLVILPNGDRLATGVHITARASDLLRYVLDSVECPAKASYLFSLCVQFQAELLYLSEDYLMVDIDDLPTSHEQQLQLLLRFKFCPTTIADDLLMKEHLIRKFAYAQMVSDLKDGLLNVVGVEQLGLLIATASLIDQLKCTETFAQTYLCGELFDWLNTGLKMTLINEQITEVREQIANLSVRDLEMYFIRSCPPMIPTHSIFLEEDDVTSFALLGVKTS